MNGGTDRRASAPRSSKFVRGIGLVAALTLALGAAACNSTTGQLSVPASAGGGLTIALESVDGPPDSVAAKLVRTLAEEAEARQIAVVSRGAPAHYRIRIYAANIGAAKRSAVRWVWDIYDVNQQRARRLSGEEPIAGASQDSWAAADDQVIRKIARVGMDRLVAFLGSSPREPAAPPAPSAAAAESPAIGMQAQL